MFARFDENPAMTLRVIKETKRYGRTDGRTDRRTDGRTDGRTHRQRENSIPPTNKVCGGYKSVTDGRTDGRTDARTDARTDGRTDNVKTVYPLQTKFAGGIIKILMTNGSSMKVESIAECSPLEHSAILLTCIKR